MAEFTISLVSNPVYQSFLLFFHLPLIDYCDYIMIFCSLISIIFQVSSNFVS